MKSIRDTSIMVGWNVERFARTKVLEDLPEYLKPVPTVVQKRNEKASRVLALMKRLAAKG